MYRQRMFTTVNEREREKEREREREREREERDREREREQGEMVDLADDLHYKIKKEMKSSGLVQDRRYHLRLYLHCFVGREAVAWMMDKYGFSRDEAVRVGNAMLEEGLLYHVTREHPFRDDYLFYRLREPETDQDTVLNFSHKWLRSTPDASVHSGQLLSQVLSLFKFHRGNSSSLVESAEYEEFRYDVCSLQAVRIGELDTADEQIVFWVNVFNTLALHVRILAGPPITSAVRPKFFNFFSYDIGGYTFTLNEIYHGILRANHAGPYAGKPPFDETDRRIMYSRIRVRPEIHFLLHLHAQSSPGMSLIVPDTLQEDTSAAIRAYISMYVKVDETRTHVTMPALFKTFASDFAPTTEGVMRWISCYMEPVQRTKLLSMMRRGKARATYLDYNWQPSTPDSLTTRHILRRQEEHNCEEAGCRSRHASRNAVD